MPWEFRVLDTNQQAELHAIYDIENKIEWYYHSESKKRSARVNAK